MCAANAFIMARGFPRKHLLATLLGLALSGCGNSADVETLVRTWQQGQGQSQNQLPGTGSSQSWDSTSPAPGHASQTPALSTWTLKSETEASRFLAQASYGASPGDMKQLVGKTANAWIEAQFAKSQTSLLDTLDSWNRQDNASSPDINDLHNVWWFSTQQEDQLRQRTAFALSQIFVISAHGAPSFYPRGMASYYDMLGRNAFGNFRQLLEEVSRHPMMGIYLTHIRNFKEQYTQDGVRYRAPDENFAREIMQLFSIGLEQLNPDGTPKLDAQGNPIPTYNNKDIEGLARVFTGWSWQAPNRSLNCFNGWHESCDATRNPGRETRLMMAYPEFHSIEEKNFLGVKIPAGSARPEESLKIALDTLFNHPNVGPFIGKQLIQRLVISNPSPAYVKRVAAAFNNNGSGVRGDMKAVLRAILLDEEARSAKAAERIDSGRIREPLLRVTHWMRAFNASSASGRWPVGRTDGWRKLNQTPLRAPSVFNFYRPGYSPANTPVANAGKVAPEMQIIQESSIADYSYYAAAISGAFSRTAYGIGPLRDVPDPEKPGQTIKMRDILPDYQTELALAKDPEKLLDHLNVLMMNGQMQPDTRATIMAAIESLRYPRNNPVISRQIDMLRVGVAVYLTMMSTDYLVLK